MKCIYLFLLGYLFCYHRCCYAQTEMEAYDLYKNAEKFMRLKKYAEASIFFDKAIVKDPTNHAILYERGKCYIKLRNFDKASYSFQRVIELREDYTNAYLLLGYLHTAVNRLDNAYSDYNAAYKLEVNMSRRFIIKLVIINILDKQGKLREAGHHLDEAKTFGIDHEHYFFFQAKYRNLHGRYKEAKDFLVKTIAKIENQHPDSVAVEMGEKLFQQTYYTPADGDEVLKQEVRLNPVNNTKKNQPPTAKLAKFYYEMYFTLYKLHQYEYAENIYEKAAFEPYRKRMDPLHQSYLYNIAYAYYQVHEYDRSKDVLDEITRNNPEHHGANALAAKLMDAIGDKAALVEQLESELITPKAGKATEHVENELLKLYIDTQQYEKALELADKVVEKKATNHTAMFYKALALSKIPDKQDETFETFEKLFKLPYLRKKEVSKYQFALGLFAFRIESYKQAGYAYKACTYMYFKSAAYRELQKILPSDMD